MTRAYSLLGPHWYAMGSKNLILLFNALNAYATGDIEE